MHYKSSVLVFFTAKSRKILILINKNMDRLITFKTAKLAKEKSFNYKSEYYFYPNDKRDDYNTLNKNHCFGGDTRTIEFHYFNGDYSLVIPAPSQTTLANWLLEKQGLFISVEIAYNEWGRYSAGIYRKAKDGKTAMLAQDGMTIFDNPIDAYEEGLFEALNLI